MELRLETQGSTRSEALASARSMAANYFGASKYQVRGRVVRATAEYIEDVGYVAGASSHVSRFIVESVWETLDSEHEWLVG